MKCPFCHADQDRVTDSRASDDGLAIRRRRECLKCQRRFTTYERYEPTTLKIIKKNGEREPFSREKMIRGLEKACWKRPVSQEEVEGVVTAVEREVYEQFEDEIDSTALGGLVMEHLRELDQVAFVRFASVYREFKDVRDFVDELKPMLKKTRRTAPAATGAGD
jgi:transcriptional repressor NrdR